MTPHRQKEIIEKRQAQLSRFNDWELQLTQRPDRAICLAAVFELYDMMPDTAIKRPVNVEGIIKMRKALACLT